MSDEDDTVANTNEPEYWLNLRFLACASWIGFSAVVAAIIIWKYEGSGRKKSGSGEPDQKSIGFIHKEEPWRSCFKGVHPAWLLAYRLLSFLLMASVLVYDYDTEGYTVFFFYTQLVFCLIRWTFTSVTVYFGFGTVFYIYGCFKHGKGTNGSEAEGASSDVECGTFVAPKLDKNTTTLDIVKSLNGLKTTQACQVAGFWGYAFQILFQVCSGAAVLTDSVFWAMIFPFLTSDDYKLNFSIVAMHSVNAAFLLGDTSLNCLRFPFFRIAYFILWTGVFIIFQWIVHAIWDFRQSRSPYTASCVSFGTAQNVIFGFCFRWPYPFLDLSPAVAPLWYFGVGWMLMPCFSISAFIIKLKHFCLSRTFPRSYRRIVPVNV